MKKLITIVFLTLSVALRAQSDFKPGYIITLDGDTVFGMIDYRTNSIMSRFCTFKDSTDKKTYYSPDDIKAYRFIDSKFFIAKNINNTNYFLEFLIKGQINIYFLSNSDGDYYYIEKNDNQLLELPFDKGIKFNNEGKEVFYKTTKHIGLLKLFMQDAPSLQTKIESIEEPQHENLIKLAQEYHNVVCDKEKCIIYEKKLPKIRISLMPFGGIANYTFDNNFVGEFGLIAYFWAPRVNENYYFKTGIVGAICNFKNNVLIIQKTPVMFHYVYQTYDFQPYLEVGFEVICFRNRANFHYNMGYALGGGLNYKITNSLSLNAGFYSDYTIIPKDEFRIDDQLSIVDINGEDKFKRLSYSIILGLKFKL